MKKTMFIFFLITYSILGVAQSISISEQEKLFSNKNLTSDRLDVFEKRAEQKLQDFNNYIQLISNKDIDLKLREHSKNTAINLFNNTGCVVYDSLLNSNIEPLIIEQFFDKLLKTKHYNIVGTAEGITIADKLTKYEEGIYTGSILYNQVLKIYNREEMMVLSSKKVKRVGIILTRKAKKFGEKEIVTWEVMLCDIVEH